MQEYEHGNTNQIMIRPRSPRHVALPLGLFLGADAASNSLIASGVTSAAVDVLEGVVGGAVPH